MRDFDDFFDFGFGFGFSPPRQRRRRGRRFRWKMFERGDLKFVILALIEEKPMHGYEVMKALERASKGTYRASPGSVYPTLQMLEDQGYLSSKEEDDRRVYRITEAGREYLDENRDAVEDVSERVSDFTSAFFGDGVRELSAAFRGLAKTTFEGGMRSADDPETIARMVEILEQATKDLRQARREARRARRNADDREAGS